MQMHTEPYFKESLETLIKTSLVLEKESGEIHHYGTKKLSF